jgi:TrmH family RNA methyltransferase
LSKEAPEDRARERRQLTSAPPKRTFDTVLTEQITSRQNPLVKRAQRVRDGDEPGYMFVEGARLVEEAVASDIAIEAMIYTAEFAETERGRKLLAHPMLSHCRGAMVPMQIMRAIRDVETPQGIVALAPHPRFGVEDALAGPAPLAVALDTLQDPGNVGTIVRAAEAAGASGVLSTPTTAEPYGPKALRAAMGSAFRFPIVRRVRLADVAHAARDRGMRILATAANGATVYSDVDWRMPTLLLVGNEGAGLSKEATELADETVAVPLAPPVESLNAAVALAVILFEAARQRDRST